MRWTVLCIVAVSACGDGGTFGLTIHARGAALVVGQDGGEAWQQLSIDDDGDAHLTVTSGFYGVLAFCRADGYYAPTTKGRFDTAGDDVDLSCLSPSTEAMLRGTTASGAQIWSGQSGSQDALDGTGEYSIRLIAGMHDVFAILEGTPSRLLVRRGVDVTSDAMLDLPIATEGVDMATMTPVVDGALLDETVVYADLNNGSETDYVEFDEDPVTTSVPPQSVLIATDHASIGASTRIDGPGPYRHQGCTAQVALGTEAPTLTLPTPFTATVTSERMTWQADTSVPWEQTRVFLFGHATGAGYVVSPEWEAAAGLDGELPLPDLPSMPGYDPTLPAFVAGDDVRWDAWSDRGIFYGDYTLCGAGDQLIW